MQLALFSTINISNETDQYYLLEPDHASYSDRVSHLFSSRRVYLDIETFDRTKPKGKGGLDAVEGCIRYLQLMGLDDEKVAIVDLGSRNEDRAEIKSQHQVFFAAFERWLSNSGNLLIAHNAIFELRWLRHQFGLRPACHISCTLVGAKTYYGDFGAACIAKADSVLPGGYGLKNLAEKLLDRPVDKAEQLSDWGGAIAQSQLDYAALDVLVTRDLHLRLIEIYKGEWSNQYTSKFLCHPKLSNYWVLENQVIRAIIDVEVAGLPCAQQKLLSQLEYVRGVKSQLETEWFSKCPYKPGSKHTLPWLKDNTDLPGQVQSTSKDALSKYIGDIPEIKLLFQLRAVSQLEKDLLSFQESSKRDGRIHSRYRTQSGVGRFSSGDTKVSKAYPNLQSISSKKNPLLREYNLSSVRTIVQAPEDCTFAVIDLSAAHARIAAGLSNDKLAIAMQNDDSIDGHSKVATYVAKAQGLDWDADYIASAKGDKSNPDSATAKTLRDTAKNTYYGWLNGAGAKRIREQIGANTGKAPTLESCEAARTGCNELYPNIPRYTRNMLKSLLNQTFRIGGHKYAVHRPEGLGHITVELGLDKYRNWSAPYTKTIGATWQYVEAIAVKEGFVAASKLIDQYPEWGLKIVNVVHDELDIECKSEHAKEAVTAVNNAFNGAFLQHLANGVRDGRSTDWTELIADSWADK